MSENSYDAILALGGGVSHGGTLSAASLARTQEAVSQFDNGAAERIIFSGGAGVDLIESVAMERKAWDMGVPESATITEKRSHSTIGNVCLTRMNITDPRGWHNLLVVTSEAHVERATRVARHVTGPMYNVDVLGVPVGRRKPGREALSRAWNEYLLDDTEAGDVERIYQRLIERHPRHALGSKSRVYARVLDEWGVLPPGPWKAQTA